MADYDQRGQQVNTQFNIVKTPQSPDPEVLLRQGIQLLEVKSYRQAANLLRSAVGVNSSLGVAYYYLALALLEGKRPKVLQRGRIEEIDQLLCTAAAVGDSDGTVQWFRALLRHDYYSGNRMNCPSPSVAEIISSASLVETNRSRLQALLVKLPMVDNHLYRELIQVLHP